MEIYADLYVGNSVKNPDKLLNRLKKHSRRLHAYVLTLSYNPSDQLEIHSAGNLARNYYQKNPPFVVGIASDYEEAVTLVCQIAEEAFAARGDCRLREYLLSKQPEK